MAVLVALAQVIYPYDLDTFLVGMIEEKAIYNHGIVINGMFLAASDLYCYWWVKGGTGAPNMDSGRVDAPKVHLQRSPPSRGRDFHRLQKVDASKTGPWSELNMFFLGGKSFIVVSM